MNNYLLGGSGHAKVVCDVLKKNGHKVLGFFDDNQNLTGFRGIENLGRIISGEMADGKYIIAIGSNGIRFSLKNKLHLSYIDAVSHPSSIIDESVEIGVGTVVMAGVVINTDTKIGEHCIINTSASVDHDCIIEDFVHVSPNATLSGGVKIGEGSHIGSGAVVLPGVNIGSWCTVGAGAVVLKDVPDGITIVGNPAKQIIKK